MKLTDADIGALERALERAQDGIIYGSRVALAQRAYLAGKRAGREDMRERAAAVLAGVIRQWMDVFPLSDVIEANRVRAVIDAIRALGVDDE